MPIRVPQIVSSQGLAAQPGPRLDPASAASLASAPGRALVQAGESLSKALADYGHVRDKLTERDMKLDLDGKLSELNDLLAQDDIALRQEGVDPLQLPATFEERGKQRVQELMGQLRYAQSGPEFQAKAAHALQIATTKQRYRALDLLDARVGVESRVQNQEDANTATFHADEKERNAARVRIGERIATNLSTGVWSKDEASSETQQILAQIEMGRARVEAQDPATRPAVIEALLNGGLKYTKAGAQLDLADSLMRQEEAAQNKRDVKMAKDAEAERKAKVDELDDKADRGELTDAELRLARTDRIAVDEDFRRLNAKVRAAGTFGGRTNDAVYNTFELALKENPYAVSAGEIRRSQEAGNLAATGPRSASTLLDLIPPDAKDPTGSAAAAKDITQKPLFKQGLHEIDDSLRGGKGPLESLTGEAAVRLENAKREYHDIARSGKFDETQLPEVARKIVDRLRTQTPLMMGDPDLVRQLRYQNPQDLLKAKAAGIIPDGEFNRQFMLMQRLGLMKGPGKDTPKMPEKTPAKKAPDARR